MSESTATPEEYEQFGVIAAGVTEVLNTDGTPVIRRPDAKDDIPYAHYERYVLLVGANGDRLFIMQPVNQKYITMESGQIDRIEK